MGAFYRELIQAGIDSQEAMSMARSYISVLQELLTKSAGEGVKDNRVKIEPHKTEEK